MRERLIGEDISLEWRPQAGLWPIHMDPSQVDQVLANLCVNARDAIAGVGHVTIETHAVTLTEADCAGQPDAVPGEYVLLAVSDDGCGMDPETAGKVFEPFFTTKQMGQGTGLGLATVYGIVRQNGGSIGVASELGKGTTFEIYLPRHASAVAERPPDDVVVPAAGGNETVLLVEDEAGVLAVVGMMLRQHGYQVLVAETPAEAIRVAAQHSGPLQLLITDVIMPEMNGRDLADALVAAHPDLKVLFMSGYTADVIAARGVLEEGVNFIQKPFAPQAVAAKVRAVLDGE